MLPGAAEQRHLLAAPEDRAWLACDMVIDASGELRAGASAAPHPPRARCTYNEVQAARTATLTPRPVRPRARLRAPPRGVRRLRKTRHHRGAINLKLPERHVVFDENGYPVSVETRERKESHLLIEECMMAANEAVARSSPTPKRLASTVSTSPEPGRLEPWRSSWCAWVSPGAAPPGSPQLHPPPPEPPRIRLRELIPPCSCGP